MKPIYKTLLLILLLLLPCRELPGGDQPVFSPHTTVSSSPNPVGSGARATGMGGAFIAVADDATAASWNPAGLTQLRKPEFSVVYSHFNRSEDFDLRHHPESSSSPSVSSDDLNYLSIAYPFTLCQRNMTISLNYQLLYEFNNNIDFKYNEAFLGQNVKKSFAIKQNGQLRTLSPAYAIQVTPRLSLGITFNFWTDNLFWSNGWTTEKVETAKTYGRNPLLGMENNRLQERYTDFSGYNMNLGVLWNINKFLTLGAVLKTPFTAHINYKLTKNSSTISLQSSSSVPLWRSSKMLKFRDDVDLNMPLSYGFGIACRFSDAFTMSADVYVTDWSNYILEDGSGQRYSLITAKSSRNSHVKDTTQVRLGAEYLFILANTVIPVRSGLLYDPEPAEGHPRDFWGFSLGTGISIKNVIFDCAYQYRHGKNVGKQNLTGYPNAKADVTQHLFLASVIYHF